MVVVPTEFMMPGMASGKRRTHLFVETCFDYNYSRDYRSATAINAIDANEYSAELHGLTAIVSCTCVNSKAS